MLTRFGIAIMWMLHFLPEAILARVGEVLGLLSMMLMFSAQKKARADLTEPKPGIENEID